MSWLVPLSDSMRPRRVLKLFLIFVLGFLFFVGRSVLQRRDLPVDAALDEILYAYLNHSSASASYHKIRAVQESLASVASPKSPRDFQIPDKYASHVAQACALLGAKRVLLVGPETSFYLHTLWLSALEAHDHRIHKCPGPALCSFHHICLPPGYPASQDNSPPKGAELASSASTLLRYVLSTSLYTATDRNDTGYITAVVDPSTGVRLENVYWLHHAQKADLVLLNRGPIPAPAWTYSGHKTLGNWTYTRELPPHLGPDKSLATQIINAAFHVTKTRFIPEVLDSLRDLQQDPSMRQKTLVWHASWNYGFAADMQRNDDDPWALYYNAQVYMQNYLMKALLPYNGVYFLPRIHPIRTEADISPTEPGPKDRLRFPLGSPNARSMEAVLLKNLVELLQRIK